MCAREASDLDTKWKVCESLKEKIEEMKRKQDNND
jgi:hypothetical protein